MYKPVFHIRIPFTKLRISLDRAILKDVEYDELKKEMKLRGYWK